MRKMFSEKQIKRMIQESPSEVVEALRGQDISVEGITSKGIANTGAIASTGDIASSGAITGKTLKQSEANYSANITAFPNITGGTSSPIFCRVQQLNQSLHIIMVGKITNNTESDIAEYGTSNSINVTLPEEIAEKLYDVNGNKASESIASDTRISGCIAICQRGVSANMSSYFNDVVMFVLNSSVPNVIKIIFGRTSQITIPPGDSAYFDARLELDLV